ncbi:MAG: rRNA maturation RNase YbeY [Magnetococcales bacterium]|nr:rRNA maturation RNase YbeY [Magnetococcales bacterium]
MATTNLSITWDHPRWPERTRRCLARAVAVVMAHEKRARLLSADQIEVAVHLTGNRAMRRINQRYRGIDRSTNVLSFPMLEGNSQPVRRKKRHPVLPLGDIVLAYGTIRREARLNSLSWSDHVIHLTIHSLLHLLGYDHEQSPQQADRQERRERSLLARLGIADPYR